MSDLPQPPAFDDDLFDPAPRSFVTPLRPGELTGPWRVVFAVAWIGVVLCFAAVWKSSRTLGLSTWWLGASAEPRPFVIQLLPFVPAVLLVSAAARRARFLPWFGVAGALSLIVVAVIDVNRFVRLGLLELLVAVAALAVSAAAFAGLLRAGPSR